MRLRSAVLAAVIGLAGLASPGQAAAPTLRLEGSGGGSAPLIVTRDLRLDLGALVPDSRAVWSGVAVRSASGATLGVSVQVRRWVEGASSPFVPEPVTTHPGGLALRPGRYELVLLAPGPASVRLPVRGSAPARLRTSSRAAGVSVHLTDLRTASLPFARYRAPVTVRPRGLALLVFHVRATAHQLSLPAMCFAAVGTAACTPGREPGTSTVLASPGSVGDGFARSYYALWGAWGGAGQHDALIDDVTVDAPRCLDALLVVA